MQNEQSQKLHGVLVASGDVPYSIALAQQLELDGHRVERSHDAPSVLRLLGRKLFDIMVLDLDLPGETGVDLISFARRQQPRIHIVLLFDLTRIDRAIDGIRRGAYFYLPRTSLPADVAFVVRKAVRGMDTESTLSEYEQNVFEEMVGGGPAMRRVIELLTKVAPTDSTVLLLGESGTGKEILANAVHRLSPRHDMPFVAVNCAALPEALLESELFGHVKGAFTGADADKRGLFEEAHGGSIFLDEIGDMAPATQAKLLRVLQDGEFRPVGALSNRRADARVIAATNRDLVEAVRDNHFREDLYFRLNVFQIRIPPLRERPEALPALVEHFLRRFNSRYGKSVKGFDPHAQALLRSYPYPGNVRELESIVAHAVILCEGDLARPADLPDQFRQGMASRLALPNYTDKHIPSLRQMEEQLIRSALEKLEGNQTETAQKLGISRSTLWRKMREYGIPSPQR